MTLPSTVTQRAEGNTYIGVTGMTVVAQTGFAIRTGFYLTNSGNYGVDMSIEDITDPPNEGIFEFVSGVDSAINIPAGSTRFIEFDFYAVKESYNTGAITGTIDLSFISEKNGFSDETFYSGPQPRGIIRNYITGLAAGYVDTTGPVTQPNTTPFVPLHPSGFLVLTGEYTNQGKPKNELYWQHPATEYYFEKYQIQISEDATSSWTDLYEIDFIRNEKTFVANGSTVNGFYYGTPTGLTASAQYLNGPDGPIDVSATSYIHVADDFNANYYYRIRGEHYDQFDTSNPVLVSYTDWVYGYALGDLNEDITNNDILTGLVSGSDTLPATGDPSTVIQCPVGDKTAIEIYFENNESNVNLKSKFDAELIARGIDNSYLNSSTGNFTGVHFILPDNYIVGSVGTPTDDTTNYPDGILKTAAIETGDIITDDASSEVKVNLYLRKNSIVAGRGGDGGNSGYSRVTDVGLSKIVGSRDLYQPKITEEVTDYSSQGWNGSPAIKITDSTITEFKIFADVDAKIYGGGGGGGGGDNTFWFSAIVSMKQAGDLSNAGTADNPLGFNYEEGADGFEGIILKYEPKGAISENATKYLAPFSVEYAFEDILGVNHGGTGGGGQGFTSRGGVFWGLNQIRLNSGAGSIYSYGLGTQNNYKQRIGDGGNGGAFGENGVTAPTIRRNNGEFSIIATESAGGRSGGLAGYAIDASVNGNYTENNFRSNLFFITQETSLSSIDGFIAYWDANDLSAGDLATWNSNLYKAGLTQPTITAGSTAPVVYDSSTGDTAKFNGNKYVLWTGTAMSAQFNNIVGSSADLLNSDISGFEIFYNMVPYRPDNIKANNSQFKNGGHRGKNYILHQWSSTGENKQFRSYFYDNAGYIVENAGISNFSRRFFDLNTSSNSLQPAASSFVYNISAGLLNESTLSYTVKYNDKILFNDVLVNANISFIDNPILGKHLDSNNDMAFAISDIVIFNKKLNLDERKAVMAKLASKNRILKTIPSSGAPSQVLANEDLSLKNRLSDNNGFAGYIVMNS